MKHFTIIFLIAVTTGHAVLFAQELDYEKECNKIDSYIFAGDYEGGINYLKQKLEVYENVESVPDSNYSFFVMELGKMYYYASDFELSEKYILKSCALDKELKGEESNDYLASLSTLTFLYNEMGLYEKAVKYASEAASVYFRREVITDSINYAFFLNNYGSLFMATGNLLKAEKYFVLAKKMNDLVFSDDHPEKAPLLHNIASLYKEMGEYGKAEKFYKLGLAIDKKYYGEQHAAIATEYNSLGMFYTTIGNIDLAEQYLLKAKGIYESIAEEKLGYVYVLVNLAETALLKGDLIQAELLCNKGKLIADTLVAQSHDIHISLMRRLAKIHIEKKEYASAISLLAESVNTLKNTNPEHIDLIVLLNLSGNAYQLIHETDSAEVRYNEALYIAGLHYNKHHKNYIHTLNLLADATSQQGRKKKAEQYFVESMELFIENIYQNFDFLSASEKQKYLAVLKGNMHRFNLFAMDYYNQDKQIAGEMFDYNLFLKGLILTSSKRVKNYGLNDTSKVEFRKRYDEWINTKEYLAKVYTLSKSEIEKRQINPDSIESIANLLEKKLTRESAVFAKHHHKKQHSWQDIKSTLQSDEAFVQIVRVPAPGSIIYVALVVSDNEEQYPQMIVLNDGLNLENEKYGNYLDNIYNGYTSNNTYHDTGSYLNYWAKIGKLVADKKTIYLLPDGVYNKINVAALMMANGEFVYENHNIVLLTSINDYTEQNEVIASNNNTAVLIGAPDFSANRQSGSMLAANHTVNSNTYFDYSNLRSGKLAPIPMSGNEVRYIDSILNKLDWKTQLFTDGDATEEIVKTVNSPEILHISTHGFFTGLKPDIENPQNIRISDNDFATTMNPLFCSGLYFAGAQNSLNGDYIFDNYSQDGILTAFEVTNLNLESTSLVVLSACETGLGDIIPGEGVFGLQRAFRVAGAENIIMSLWKVDDRATQLFMKKFYTFWLSGDTKSEAFDKTINFLRFNTKDYTHPVYWGGFVLLGMEPPPDKKVSAFLFVVPLIVLILLAIILRYRKKISNDMFIL